MSLGKGSRHQMAPIKSIRSLAVNVRYESGDPIRMEARLLKGLELALSKPLPRLEQPNRWMNGWEEGRLWMLTRSSMILIDPGGAMR